MTGLSNQFEPFIVFDPSEFEGPKFDCIYNAPSFRKLEFVDQRLQVRDTSSCELLFCFLSC